MWRFIISSILLIILGLCVFGAAGTGGIHGFVVTGSGTGIPGVTVIVEDGSAKVAARLVTGTEGVFHAGELPEGTYRVRAELAGFEPVTAEAVAVAPGQRPEVRLTLERLAGGEVVNVRATAPGAGLEYTALRESGARDIGEALGGVAGVWMQRRGGIANDVIVRGQHGDNVAVLIDGAPLHGACPNRMDPPAFHVDFAEVERVELGKGPFDVTHLGGVAGVINVVTAPPEPGFSGRVSMSGGSFGYVNPSVSVSGGGDRWALRGGYTYRQSGVYEDGDGVPFTAYTNYLPGAGDSDAFRIHTGWVQGAFVPVAGQTLRLGYTRQQADQVLYPTLQMDAVYDNADRVDVQYRVDDLPGFLERFFVQVYGNRVQHWMTDADRTSGAPAPRGYSMGTDAFASTAGGRVESSWSGLSIGLEFSRRRWDTTTMLAGMGYNPQASIPDVVADTIGAFAAYEHSFSDRLRLRAGGRVDRSHSAADPELANTNLYYAFQDTRSTSATDTAPSGFAQATWSLARDVELTAGVGHSVRFPDPQERYFALRRMGSDWVGNPELDPVRTTGLECGARWRHSVWTVAGTVYYQFLHDFITVYSQPRQHPVTGIMNAYARSYGNVGAEIWGGEADMSVALTNRLFVSGDLAWVRGTKDLDGTLPLHSPYLAEIPPFTARARIRYDAGWIFGQAEGVASDAQERVDADLQEQTTAGYGVMNLSVGSEYRNFRVSLNLNNLFDRKYFDYFSYRRDPFASGVKVPEPGRAFTVTAQYQF
jgi:iron complex outermembrane receptor protein